MPPPSEAFNTGSLIENCISLLKITTAQPCACCCSHCGNPAAVGIVETLVLVDRHLQSQLVLHPYGLPNHVSWLRFENRGHWTFHPTVATYCWRLGFPRNCHCWRSQKGLRKPCSIGSLNWAIRLKPSILSRFLAMPLKH